MAGHDALLKVRVGGRGSQRVGVLGRVEDPNIRLTREGF